MVKTSWKFHPFGGKKIGVELYIWDQWSKIENNSHKLSLFNCVKYVIGFLLPKIKRLWQETLSFLNIARARQSSVGVNVTNIFTCIAIETHPNIDSQKMQLKCWMCTEIVHAIKSCTLNFKHVWDAESATVRVKYKIV